MNVSYTLSINPSVAESFISSSTNVDSQFFIRKEEGLVWLEIEYNPDLEFSSEIFSIDKTKTKTKVLSNTENILATNIVINDIAYYYKLHSIGANVDYKTVILNSSIDCVEYKGNIYTNSIVSNIEVSPGLYIHSVPVIDKTVASIKYKSDCIEITYPSSLGDLSFRTESDSIINPLLINTSKVYIPSFYIKEGYKSIKCIEGDIRYINKKELTSFVGNSISCKDLIQTYDNHFYNKQTNRIYLQNFNYQTTPALINYTAKISSHVFRMEDDVLYFKITKQGLVTSTKTDYSFILRKKIDETKLKVYISNYLDAYKVVLKPSDFIIRQNESTDESSNVGLKKQVVSPITKFPSESVYIEYRNRYILQHTNNILSDTVDLVESDTYSDVDYEFTVNDTLYNDYKFIKIGSTYYYKNSNPYFTLFKKEDDVDILFEDMVNFLLEF